MLADNYYRRKNQVTQKCQHYNWFSDTTVKQMLWIRKKYTNSMVHVLICKINAMDYNYLCG